MNFSLYNSYSRAMDFLGFDRQISRFIDNLVLDQADVKDILDVGCGTGAMGLQWLTRFPESTLLATDIQERFLEGVLSNAESMGIPEKRISVGLSNVSKPSEVHLKPGGPLSLEWESFDLISMGAVVGYAKDQQKAISALLRLLRPGGILINLEMNETLTGRWTSYRYEYPVMPLKNMKTFIADQGCDVSILPLPIKYFPASLTRVGMVIRRKHSI